MTGGAHEPGSRWSWSLLAALVCATGCGPEAPARLGRFEPPPVVTSIAAAERRAEGGAEGDVLTVSGRVAAVCPSAGCWLDLEDDGTSVRVELLGFSVDRSREGANCRAQGKFVEQGGQLVFLARGVAFDD